MELNICALRLNRFCWSNSIFACFLTMGWGKLNQLWLTLIFDLRWKRWSPVLRRGQMLWTGWFVSPGQVEALYTTHAGEMSSAAPPKVTPERCSTAVHVHLTGTAWSIYEVQEIYFTISCFFQCWLSHFQAERAEPKSHSFTVCSRSWMKLLAHCCQCWKRSHLLFLATGRTCRKSWLL